MAGKIDGNLTWFLQRGDDDSISLNFSGGEIYTHDADDILTLTVREFADSPIIFQKTSYWIEDDPDRPNAAVIPIDHADTAELEPGTYVYDIQMTWANGKVSTIIPKHRLILEDEVTY